GKRRSQPLDGGKFVLRLAEFSRLLPHFFGILTLSDFIIFLRLRILTLSPGQIYLRLLDGGGWFVLRLLQDDLFLFYRIPEVDEFITSLTQLQRGVEFRLDKFRLLPFKCQL